MPLSDATLDHLRAVADLPDLRGTPYRVIGRLGRGGMGTVYAAHDTRLDRVVALKVLNLVDADGALASRMLREARVLARLEHPGIVPVHDVGRLPDGRVYTVMKRVDGLPLDAWAAANPDRAARLRVFRSVCETLAFAHSRGIVHRDIKPGNIMVGSFGEVLVMDWGAAKRAGAGGDGPGAARAAPAEQTDPNGDGGAPAGGAVAAHDAADAGTAHGTRIGTPGFMAPEQARGDSARADARADVYGLGALLHTLVHDAPPGEAATPAGPRGRRAQRTPRRLAAILDRALADEPAGRYATAGALLAEIDRFAAGEPVEAYREPVHERVARFAMRHRTAILLVLAYLAARVLLFAFAPG